MSVDRVLDTLFLPFRTGVLSWPATGRVLFLRARIGAQLRELANRLVCEQTYKPLADALIRAGIPVNNAEKTGNFPLVLLLPPRQREEARTLLARAVSALDTDGIVVACAANDTGARALETDLARLAGPVTVLSKNKCRVFWTQPTPLTINARLLEEWRALDAPRPILNDRFTSRPGVFAWDRIDPASALLARHLPTDLTGCAADLGCGWGYLACELLTRTTGLTALDLYEAELRALDLARLNLQPLAERCALGFHWHDVTTGLLRHYDVIVANPPFHGQDGRDRPDVGRCFIEAAAAALYPGGRLWLVANRHLPYETTLEASFAVVRHVAQTAGFKVIEAIKAARAKR